MKIGHDPWPTEAAVHVPGSSLTWKWTTSTGGLTAVCQLVGVDGPLAADGVYAGALCFLQMAVFRVRNVVNGLTLSVHTITIS